MKPSQLDSFASHLIDSYLETYSFSRRFKDDHDYPPTLILKVQYMYAVAQGALSSDERYVLSQDWIEFGRVAFTDREDDRDYVLRSDSAVTIELGKRRQDEVLFDPNHYLRTDTTLLVHRFHKEGLDLSVAGTAQRDTGRGRLSITGPPVYVGTWPFGSDGTGGTAPFNQGGGDPFGDLGDMRDFGGGRQ